MGPATRRAVQQVAAQQRQQKKTNTKDSKGRDATVSRTKRRKAAARRRASSTSSEESTSESSSSESEEEEVDWVGERFASDRSQKAYAQVRVIDTKYSTGDSALVDVEGFSEFQPLIIQEFWEDEEGEKWAYGTWYYHPFEVGTRPRGTLSNELFESAMGDNFPVTSLRGKLDVVTKEEEAVDETMYLCRHFFDPTTKNVFPRPSLSENSLKKKRKRYDVPKRRDTGSESRDKENEEVEALDEYDRARRVLQLSAVPNVLPCRDRERERIQTFLENGIVRGGSQLALYISGMPGTGKTASFYEVIRSLNSQQRQGKLPRFRFVELNGLKLPNPEEAYPVLASLILNESAKMSAARACQALETYFSTANSKREVCVLLIDEIDQLVTKKQQILYNIFDWPQRPHAKLVVVGIANTMDLPERLLPRIQSRLGEGRIMFAPYNREQIEQIVKHRLKDIQLFDQNAIDFSARKVAGLSGDVRRALQLCRRAVDICKRQGKPKVMIEHINAAVKEIDSKLHCQVITSLSVVEKLFLICTHKHAKAIGGDQLVFFQDVLRRMKGSSPLLPELAAELNHVEATRNLYLTLMAKLVRLGLLKIEAETGQCSLGPAVSLTFDFDDLRIALEGDQLLERIL